MQVGPFEYRACPVLFLEPDDEQLVAWVRDGLELPPPLERAHLPARLVDGLVFLEQLKGD